MRTKGSMGSLKIIVAILGNLPQQPRPVYFDIRKLSNLILYSSLWIALCAGAQVQYTYDVTGHVRGLDAFTGFVITATIALYSVHRIVGIRKVSRLSEQGRFAIILRYKSHIVLYGIAGACLALYFATRLPVVTLGFLLIPTVFSGAYVLPVNRNWMRIRDYPYVKIFVLSACWALITGVAPLIHTRHPFDLDMGLVFAERFLFVMAISLPFDIRDIYVDEVSDLRTIPQRLGVGVSKWLAAGSLALSALCVWFLISRGFYAESLPPAYGIFIVITTALIAGSKPGLDDHYYSGLLDGTMFLLPFLFWIITL